MLGHSVERLGWNDFDQMLALKGVMPSLGFGDELTTGLPIPKPWN